MIYNSAWNHPTLSTYSADEEGSILFPVMRSIRGDILIRCYHLQSGGGVLGKQVMQIFHLSLSTGFLLSDSNVGVIRFPKKEVDDAHDSTRFPDGFFVDIIFSEPPVVKPGILSCRQTLSSTPVQLRMGWMVKQGGFVKNWKRRWFVLTSKTLSYFTTAAKPQPLGVLRLEVS